jgi:hypothetical protein
MALRHYCLQVENLDWIIFMVKYWPNDPHLNCSINANFKDYIKVGGALGKKNCELMKNLNILKS